MGKIHVYHARQDQIRLLDIAATTLDEATLKTDHGVYCVFRTYPGQQVLRLEGHLNRMRRSARLLNKPYPLSNDWLQNAIHAAVEQSGIEIARIRLTVPYAAPDTALIAIEAFTPPAPELYESGVKVGLAQLQRETARAKDSRFIEIRQKLHAQYDPPLYEIMLCGEDKRIYEGTGSNFYAVLNDRLYTANDGVLEGITRKIILELAPEIVEVILEPILVQDLSQVSEAMMSSSSRGVMPIVEVDGIPIDNGKPGPTYQALRKAYNIQVENELKPL